jgi:hypothetical protein
MAAQMLPDIYSHLSVIGLPIPDFNIAEELNRGHPCSDYNPDRELMFELLNIQQRKHNFGLNSMIHGRDHCDLFPEQKHLSTRRRIRQYPELDLIESPFWHDVDLDRGPSFFDIDQNAVSVVTDGVEVSLDRSHDVVFDVGVSAHRGDVYNVATKSFVPNYDLKPPLHTVTKCREVMTKWFAIQNANRKVFNYCVFCGDPDNVKHWKIEDLPLDFTHYDFCSVGPCIRYFRNHYESRYLDIEHGIPIVYDREFPELRRKPDSRGARKKADGTPVNLQCAFCGKRNPKIITNGALVNKEKYIHASFCQNSECCEQYVDYMQSRGDVPHALRKTVKNRRLE